MRTVLKVLAWPFIALAKLVWWYIKIHFYILKGVLVLFLIAFISTDV